MSKNNALSYLIFIWFDVYSLISYDKGLFGCISHMAFKPTFSLWEQEKKECYSKYLSVPISITLFKENGSVGLLFSCLKHHCQYIFGSWKISCVYDLEPFTGLDFSTLLKYTIVIKRKHFTNTILINNNFMKNGNYIC